MFHYIDYIISLDKSKFGDYVDRIYPAELEKRTPQKSDSYIDLHLEIDDECRFRTDCSLCLSSLHYGRFGSCAFLTVQVQKLVTICFIKNVICTVSKHINLYA